MTTVFAVGFVAAAYLNYVQYQNHQDAERQLSGTVTDLRYELDKQRAGAQASPSPSATPSPTATPTPTPAPEASATPTPAPAAKTATVNQFVYLHTEPNVSSPVVMGVNKGMVVTLGATLTNNYQQVTVGDKAGYILQSRLTY